ncbi:phosphodiester glycosidase family protein [Prosthecobacter sp.]|uniref:phosphodiester glycosidase family protein n=1 Tax=Prosthecobacter sp. TaxID=1965333 RepID=UPI001DDC0E27|nr:phosphodiester glycosidase family protein [Prosthecobacter sp.]MCB1277501.1 phosphodiester glycosidase family protein [Prosthecobacter sp.]
MKWLLCLLMLTCHAQGQWRLESSSKAASVGHGAVYVVKQISGPAKAEIRLVVFDEKQCRLRVVVNSDRKTALSLDELGLAENALAVCNGGYFHAGGDFGPAGLEIAGGVRQDKFTAGPWVGGLMVKQDNASLVWENEFRDSPDITEFLQCSPWLISEGRVWPAPPSKEPEQRNHRTFIITDTEGRWAIGTCKRTGLLELAHILITPGIISELKVTRALNLDGGPSTGLWCRSADGRTQFEKPGWDVRNVIAVVPRDSE